MRSKLIAGNWKSNGQHADVGWVDEVANAYKERPSSCQIAICPPLTLLGRFKEKGPDWLALGGQDCSTHDGGAHTGEISAKMLADSGCSYVIVGHSERRAAHGESDAIVKTKASLALAAGLTPIICIGETLEERDSGQANAVCESQLLASIPDAKAEQIVLAYEPVWAIGTGRTATAEQAQAIHAMLRQAFPQEDRDKLRILYGGSVKADNAAELLSQPDIDGALVGGASLDAKSFMAIIDSLQ